MSSKEKTKVEEIITHNGRFHADESLAIAFLRYKGIYAPIRRVNKVTQEELDNPKKLVVDVGMSYDPAKNNFDHHQDSSLPASNMLILRHFEDNPEVIVLLERHLFKFVSDVDRGLRKPEFGVPTLSNIISSMNETGNGIEEAINVCKSVVAANSKLANNTLKSYQLWKGVTKEGHLAIQENTKDHITSWKAVGGIDNIWYFIHPYERDSTWGISTIDSGRFPIPPTGQQFFRHNSGHFATYKSLEHAKEDARIFIKAIERIQTERASGIDTDGLMDVGPFTPGVTLRERAR